MNISTKFIVFRNSPNGWTAIHVNIDTAEIANTLLARAKKENPKDKYKVIQVIEHTIYEEQ